MRAWSGQFSHGSHLIVVPRLNRRRPLSRRLRTCPRRTLFDKADARAAGARRSRTGSKNESSTIRRAGSSARSPVRGPLNRVHDDPSNLLGRFLVSLVSAHQLEIHLDRRRDELFTLIEVDEPVLGFLKLHVGESGCLAEHSSQPAGYACNVGTVKGPHRLARHDRISLGRTRTGQDDASPGLLSPRFQLLTQPLLAQSPVSGDGPRDEGRCEVLRQSFQQLVRLKQAKPLFPASRLARTLNNQILVKLSADLGYRSQRDLPAPGC